MPSSFLEFSSPFLVRPSQEHMRLVLGMKSELQRLQRRIRPMTAVVRHLMDDEQIGQDMKVYLEDVLDHVVRGLEEIGGCIEMCDSTKEEFKSLRVTSGGGEGGEGKREGCAWDSSGRPGLRRAIDRHIDPAFVGCFLPYDFLNSQVAHLSLQM